VSHFYFDSSALVKRYNPEAGSEWVESLAGQTIILSEITLVEVAAALAAKHRAPNGITRKERDDVVALFLSHCHAEYELIAVSRPLVDRAVTLTQRHRLRGYDAMQLATALAADEALVAAGLPHLTFVAADDDLLAAARDEGLAAENPDQHP
jgi:predicted nucleic acid-binding protein